MYFYIDLILLIISISKLRLPLICLMITFVNEQREISAYF